MPSAIGLLGHPTQPFLSFFSWPVLRGGPRILAHLAACLLVLIVLVGYALRGLSDLESAGRLWDETADGVGPKKAGAMAGKGAVKLELVRENDGLGGLRMVVFGQRDVGTPIRGGGETEKEKTWTDMLCDELDCSPCMSFVPKNASVQPMTSNDIYAQSVETTIITTDSPDAFDYSFLREKFPAHRELPDLRHQITKFLSLPKPATVSADTLWVFSFGLWDIWSLAALPLNTGKQAVNDLVDHVFDQIDRVYRIAQDQDSIAWSNASLLPLKKSKEEGQRATKSHNTAETTPRFRILIPFVFDPSLTPGWLTQRPDISGLHAEQLRNAAMLTGHWNARLHNVMGEWIRHERPAYQVQRQAEQAESEIEQVSAHARPANLDQKLHAAAAHSTKWHGTSAVVSTEKTYKLPSFESRPLRDGIHYDMARLITDMIVDQQFRHRGLSDANGVGGKRSETSRFLEVKMPCRKDGSLHEALTPSWGDKMHSEEKKSGQELEKETDEQVEHSSLYRCANHLFLTPFTLSQRAILEVAREATILVTHHDPGPARWAPPAKASVASSRLVTLFDTRYGESRWALRGLFVLAVAVLACAYASMSGTVMWRRMMACMGRVTSWYFWPWSVEMDDEMEWEAVLDGEEGKDWLGTGKAWGEDERLGRE